MTESHSCLISETSALFMKQWVSMGFEIPFELGRYINGSHSLSFNPHHKYKPTSCTVWETPSVAPDRTAIVSMVFYIYHMQTWINCIYINKACKMKIQIFTKASWQAIPVLFSYTNKIMKVSVPVFDKQQMEKSINSPICNSFIIISGKGLKNFL